MRGKIPLDVAALEDDVVQQIERYRSTNAQ